MKGSSSQGCASNEGRPTLILPNRPGIAGAYGSSTTREASAGQLVGDGGLQRVAKTNSSERKGPHELEVVRGHGAVHWHTPRLFAAFELPRPWLSGGRPSHADAVMLEQAVFQGEEKQKFLKEAKGAHHSRCRVSGQFALRSASRTDITLCSAQRPPLNHHQPTNQNDFNHKVRYSQSRKLRIQPHHERTC